MIDSAPNDTPRGSRWLPAAVVSLFALVFFADLVVVALYGNYRNLVEENGVEIGFLPASVAAESSNDEDAERRLAEGDVITASDGRVAVERSGDRIVVRAPGTLTMRFRAPDAGLFLELGYRFLRPDQRAQCEVSVARVASSYGVDVVRRKKLVASKRSQGRFRHNLADHAGWFELRLRVNQPASQGGFEVGLPQLVDD